MMQPPPPPTASPTGGRILLVEDDADIAQVVQEVLAPAGYRVVTAPTLAAATLLLRQQPIALVLVDGLSHLPEAAFANAMTVRSLAGSIPVVLFTAHPVAPAAMYQAGFAAHLPKPFELDDLVDTVARLVLAAD